MSQEQENQNQEVKAETTETPEANKTTETQQKVEVAEKSCKTTCLCVLTWVSLVCSILALGLSGWNTYSMNGGGGGSTSEGKKVVISKQYDKGQSLDKAIASQKPIIAFFYTDWCGFCQRFVPTFYKVTKDKEIKKNFAIAYVNCEDIKNRGYMQEYEIQGFPTVYVIRPDGKKVHLDNNTFFKSDSVEVVKADALKVLDEE